MEKKSIKRYNINYGYTTFLAFSLNLRYSGTKKISIDSLKEYPHMLLGEVREILDTAYITMINDENDFEKNIELNKELFKEENGYLILNEKITQKDLFNVIDKYDYPFTDLLMQIIIKNNTLKEMLNLTGIRNMIYKLENVESLIEEYYNLSAFDGKMNLNYKIKLQQLMKSRNSFYYALLNSNSVTIEDFEDESETLLEDPYETFYPIDIDNDYDCLFEDEVYLVDEILANPYLIAYFTNQPLSFYRIAEDISNLSLKYCCLGDYENQIEFKELVSSDLKRIAEEKGKFVYTTRSKIELLFMLSLIKNIDEIKNNTEDEDTIDSLQASKQRLIYMLDDVSLNLYQETNLDDLYNSLLEKYNNNSLYKEEDLFESESCEILTQYGMLSKVFIFDIFDGLYDEELNKKKLAFIKTYYDLTQDKEVLSILNKYSDHQEFWKISKYIRNNNQNLVRKKFH